MLLVVTSIATVFHVAKNACVSVNSVGHRVGGSQEYTGDNQPVWLHPRASACGLPLRHAKCGGGVDGGGSLNTGSTGAYVGGAGIALNSVSGPLPVQGVPPVW